MPCKPVQVLPAQIGIATPNINDTAWRKGKNRLEQCHRQISIKPTQFESSFALLVCVRPGDYLTAKAC
jgi:hypothetical protein